MTKRIYEMHAKLIFYMAAEDDWTFEDAQRTLAKHIGQVAYEMDMVGFDEVDSHKYKLDQNWSWNDIPYTLDDAPANPFKLKDYVDFPPENE